ILDSRLKNLVKLTVINKQSLYSNSLHEHFFRFIYDILHLVIELWKNETNIVHIHTSYDGGWLKHCFYIIIVKILRSKIIIHIHAYHKACRGQFPKIWLKRYIFPPWLIFKLVDGIITLSDKDTQRIVQTGIKKSILTIENGILLENFKKNSDIKKSQIETNLIYLGNIEKRKGISELIAILPKIIFNYDNINAVIAGEGRNKDDVISWYATLSEIAKKRIQIVGRVSEEKKIE